MYLVVKPPHQITTLGGVLFLIGSHTIIQILKCTGSPLPPPDALVQT